MPYLSENPDGVTLRLRVIPRAAQSRMEGPLGNALKVRLQAPPVEGKANTELIKFLAKTLKVPASSIELLRGATHQNKTLLIRGLDRTAFESRYTSALL